MTDTAADNELAYAPDNRLALSTTDEDATKIDDLLVDTKAPPAPNELPTAPAEPDGPIAPAGNNRLIGGSTALSVGWSPTPITPPDPDRYELHIYAASDTPTDFVLIASDPTHLGGEASSARLYSGQELVLRHYTGAIYAITGTGATGPVTVTATAVTK